MNGNGYYKTCCPYVLIGSLFYMEERRARKSIKTEHVARHAQTGHDTPVVITIFFGSSPSLTLKSIDPLLVCCRNSRALSSTGLRIETRIGNDKIGFT